MSTELFENYAGVELRIICFYGQTLYHNFSAIVAFGALKQGLHHQRYEAKSRNKNLIISVFNKNVNS